jgi:phosphoribosyl 1,2-cyclic phosphodiesterase
VVSHEHTDHTTSAVALAKRLRIPIIATAGTLRALLVPAGVETVVCRAGEPLTFGAYALNPVRVSHDAAEPIGMAIHHGEHCVTIATDLGEWDDALLHACRAAELVVIESNHEPEHLMQCGYTATLKMRIASATGHLDNVQAGNFLAALAADQRPRTAWLAHLSQEANTATVALRSVAAVLRFHQQQRHFRDIVALPRHATVVWGEAQRGVQLPLWGSDE